MLPLLPLGHFTNGYKKLGKKKSEFELSCCYIYKYFLLLLLLLLNLCACCHVATLFA
jgi:hypothetical protein